MCLSLFNLNCRNQTDEVRPTQWQNNSVISQGVAALIEWTHLVIQHSCASTLFRCMYIYTNNLGCWAPVRMLFLGYGKSKCWNGPAGSGHTLGQYPKFFIHLAGPDPSLPVPNLAPSPVWHLLVLCHSTEQFLWHLAQHPRGDILISKLHLSLRLRCWIYGGCWYFSSDKHLKYLILMRFFMVLKILEAAIPWKSTYTLWNDRHFVCLSISGSRARTDLIKFRVAVCYRLSWVCQFSKAERYQNCRDTQSYTAGHLSLSLSAA